jgi:hypothetical protein
MLSIRNSSARVQAGFFIAHKQDLSDDQIDRNSRATAVAIM